MNEQTNLDANLEKDALRILKAETIKEKVQAKEEDGFDAVGEKIKLIPTPNFSEAKSVGTMLPINMANETVTNLSLLAQEFDFIDFIKEKLGYSSRVKVVQCFASEQIDALVLAIKSFEKNNAFILGDMAGIGKGRVCAGVIRYAYMQGMIPVFLTQKPYLLNDIYRDLTNIDGMGINAKGQRVEPRPFVMHQDGVVVDREGNPIPTNQSYKTTYTNGESVFRFVNNGNPYSINELCKTMTDDIERTGQVKLMKDFNCVMLPYSVISQSKSSIRRGFLSAIAPNSLFVFDESHNAASANEKSNILRTGIPLVEASKAVLFSSATYAKNPNVFNLYVVKTALRTAVPSLEAITDALKVGGENVSEYIASGLVTEGQMIRRERSFGSCKKVTEYVGTIRSEDSFGNTRYSDISDDKQRAFFDEAISYFKELRDFSKSEMAAEAIDIAVRRAAANLNKEVANMRQYQLAKNASKEEEGSLQSNFVRDNKNKYILEYNTDSITRYKATFRENLFLAIKAKFAADKIIDCLNTPVQYTNEDGTTHVAPMKPVIAVANTGEAIFADLLLEDGQEVRNDFAEYLRAIFNKMFVGSFSLRKVDSNIFESKSSLAARGIDYELIKGDFEVQLSDFRDGGEMIAEIQSRLREYESELPFSIIDYIRDRIENTPRSTVYYGQNGTPIYGFAQSPYYRFAEATSRNYMLKRDENGVLRFKKNDRIKSTTKVFRAFNNGSVDVMLINVVASTGGSAQSSPEEGVDTRPRNMFIVQFELDINIEVQKRGRINRTGQINSPTYTYIITKIPVELRKYLMFRKKLRKLDANTSADQTASSKTAEITDAKGNPIEDIFNHYGFEVFKNDFIDLPDNTPYLQIFQDMQMRTKSGVDAETAEGKELKVQEFEVFVRELELYPTDFQEYFFDEMNEKYIQKKAVLIAQGEYQEELQSQNYKASLKQRVVVQLNSGSTVFSLPLFLSDYYTLESRRPLSKDRVYEKANELAVWEGQPKTPDEFYAKFVEDYLRESSVAVQTLQQELDAMEAPDRKDFAETDEGQDRYEKAMFMFDARKASRMDKLQLSFSTAKSMLAFFSPFKKVVYEGNLGMFIGYKIRNTGTKFKYTDGSIEFVFCFLSKYPTLSLKLSSDREELNAIRSSTSLFLYSDNVAAEEDKKRIEIWQPNLNKRQIRRFFSGNILSGIVEANKRKNLKEFKSWTLTRFTNIDGSQSTAIEIKYESDLPETSQIQGQELAVAADNRNILDYIRQLPETTGTDFVISEGVLRRQTIYPIWNLEGDKICDRAICLYRKEKRFIRPDQTSGTYEVVTFEIMQSYKTETEKSSGRKLMKERKEGEVLYNYLFHDKEFEEMFSDYLVNQEPEKTKIKYAFLRLIKKEGLRGATEYTSKYNDFNTYIKRYTFRLSDTDSIMLFLSELYNKYGIMFNFRSSAADYFNVSTQSDLFDPTKKQEVKAFPDGEYRYRFNKRVSDSVIDTIPNLISRNFDGAYGGVTTSQPIMPTMLPSFDMKPFGLPNEVYVKLTLAVLKDEDKTQFAKELEELAEIKNEDAYTIGEFVRSFLSQRSVGMSYFFGDMRVSEYGSLFREYALKQDLEKIIIEERGDVVIVEGNEVKTEVTLEDAENFIIKLWSLI